MKILHRLSAIAIIILVAVSCGRGNSSSNPLAANRAGAGDAKYIFYFIGDGMSATQVRLAEAALSSPEFQESYTLQSGTNTPEELFIKSLGVTGLATTNAENRYITDSAAAGTALATGTKTSVGVISQTTQGERITTIAERAKAKGMKVGIVSSVSIDHATPACFYAHTKSRSNYASISDQLISSGFDYFGGGYVKLDSRARAEDCDVATAYSLFSKSAQHDGYTLTTSKEQFDSAKAGEKVIATLEMLSEEQYGADGFALPYTIDLCHIDNPNNKITLADFTRKGIELLDNKNGFFMMVEGGKIDWACHANDAVSAAYEMIAFDSAIGVALEFAAKHPRETLIVVTGDHDCGGLSIGFAGTHYESAFSLLAHAKSSYARFSELAKAKIEAGESFDELLALACEQYGFTNKVEGEGKRSIEQSLELSDFEVKMLREAYNKSRTRRLDEREVYMNAYGGYDPFTTTCTSILNNKAGIEFASFSHTAVPVMVFADGAGAELFSGYYDNTDIAKSIAAAAGI